MKRALVILAVILGLLGISQLVSYNIDSANYPQIGDKLILVAMAGLLAAMLVLVIKEYQAYQEDKKYFLRQQAELKVLKAELAGLPELSEDYSLAA